jgi:hypothetical protein
MPETAPESHASLDPYAPPRTDLAPVGLSPDADAVADAVVLQLYSGRVKLIRIVAVLGLGLSSLQAVGGLFGALSAVQFGRSPDGGFSSDTIRWDNIFIGGLGGLGIGVLGGVLWLGLRALRPWARTGIILLSGLAVAGLALGAFFAAVAGRQDSQAIVPLFLMAFPGFVLYVLVSPDCTVIFSPKFRELWAGADARNAEKTPGVRRRQGSVARWTLIAVIASLTALVLAGSFAYFAAR